MTISTLNIPEIRGTSQIVPVDSVFPNPWNPNRMDDAMFEKTKNSLQRFSQSSPLICREISRGYEIIDGEHRWRAAKDLGRKEVAIWNLGEMDDAAAKQMTIMFNELRGHPDIDSLSELVAELDKELGRVTLVENLPFTEQQIENMIDTLHFDWNTFEAEDEAEQLAGKKDIVRMNFFLTQEQHEEVQYAFRKGMEAWGLEGTDENRATMLTTFTKYWLHNEDL